MPELTIQETFKAKIDEKVRESFMELIPDELISSLVSSALDTYINGPRDKRFESKPVYDAVTGRTTLQEVTKTGYDPHNDPNTLPGMIYLQLFELGKSAIAKEFERPEWQSRWDNGQIIIPVINELVKDNADVFIQALLRSIVSSAMSNVISAIKQSNANIPFMPY